MASGELERLEIEISVMGPIELVTDVDDNRYIDLKGSMPINIKASIKAPLDALAAAKKWERLDFAEAVHACSEISIGQISNPFLDTK